MKKRTTVEGELLDIEQLLCDVNYALSQGIGAIDEIRETVVEPKPCDIVRSGPVTVVRWTDDTVTRTRCQPGDVYDREKGFLYCVIKKAYPDTWRDIMRETCWDAAE